MGRRVAEVTEAMLQVKTSSTAIPLFVPPRVPGIRSKINLHSFITVVLGQQIQASDPPPVPVHEVQPMKDKYEPKVSVGLPGGANVAQVVGSPHLVSMMAVDPPPPHVQVVSPPELLRAS
jgi:hypothetical protein